MKKSYISLQKLAFTTSYKVANWSKLYLILLVSLLSSVSLVGIRISTIGVLILNIPPNLMGIFWVFWFSLEFWFSSSFSTFW